MTLRDIFGHVLVNSGCIALSEENIELKIVDFQRIVEQALAYANKYDPDDRKVYISVGNNYSYDFTGNEKGEGGFGRVPRWISDVVPNQSTGSNLSRLLWINMFNNNGMMSNNYSPKDEFIFSYQSPTLYVDRQGTFEVHACYAHISVPIYDYICENGKQSKEKHLVDIDYPTMTLERDPFLLLVQGKFLQGIGRYRRAFTLNDLPLTMDAGQLVDEGNRFEEQAKQAYQEDQSRFFLAFQ